MNKVLPWGVKANGARAVAEEAARRQGLGLDEWLTLIAEEEAAEAGAKDARRVAVATQLGRSPDRAAKDVRVPLAARASDRETGERRRPQERGERHVPREAAQVVGDEDAREARAEPQEPDVRPARKDEARGNFQPRHKNEQHHPRTEDEQPQRTKQSRRSRDRHRDDARPAPARHERFGRQASDFDAALYDAVEAFDQRVARRQKHANEALANVAELLESRVARQEDQQGTLSDLFDRLDEVEERITRRLPEQGLSPIKGALERLEARVESLSQPPAPAPRPEERSEPKTTAPDAAFMQRLEAKIDAALAARQSQPRPQAPALADAAPAAVPPRRSMGEAIADIANRQRALDAGPAGLAARRERSMAPLAHSEAGRPAARAFEAAAESGTSTISHIQRDIAHLAFKLDDMRREMAERSRVPNPAPRGDELDALRLDIARMSNSLGDLAPRGSVAAVDSAIRLLTESIESSRDRGTRESLLQPLESLVSDLRHSLAEIDPRATIKDLERELRSMGRKLEDLAGQSPDANAFRRVEEQTQEIRDFVSAAAAVKPVEIDKIERQLAALAERIDQQVTRPTPSDDLRETRDEIRAALSRSAAHPVLQKIELRLEDLGTKVDAALSGANGASHYAEMTRRMEDMQAQIGAAEAVAPTGAIQALEAMVQDLAASIESVRQPEADSHAYEALERQVGRLAERLEKTDSGFSVLATLQQSVGDLFAELEETRKASLLAADSAARTAAREAAQNVAAQFAEPHDSAVSQDLARLRTLQDAADHRTHATLNAVHGTLEKVVDRLALLERDIAEVRPSTLASGPAPVFSAPAERRPDPPRDPAAPKGQSRSRQSGSGVEAPPAALKPRQTTVEPDVLIEPGAGFPPRRNGTSSESAADGAPEAARSDFIAAARRAAQAAQADVRAASMRPQILADETAERGAVLDHAKTYIAKRKRAIAVGLAAVFMVAGTYAVMKIGHTADGTPIELPKQPAKAVSRLGNASRTETAAAARSLSPVDSFQAAALSPTPTLPASAPIDRPQMAGSDPIVTGTIAARPGTPESSRFTGSLSEQADAGNPAAQYELANRIAEGKLLPRDFKLAAQWYEKAALQGLAPAQYRLASLYEKGVGIPRDVGRAKSWYIKAADQGNARAMHNLAVVTAEGSDGKPDYAGAAAWFRKAADYGIRDSQYNLAILLARGLGVAQNLPQSYTWFAIAAAQGDEDAGKKRDEVAARLDPKDLAAARTAADGFRPRTPDQASNEVPPPPGGWDASAPRPASRPVKPRISSL